MHINKYFIYEIFSMFSTIISIQNIFLWTIDKLIIRNNQKEVF